MKEIILSEEEIREVIARLGKDLTKKFKKSGSVPVFVGVLKGATMFMMDLIRQCDFPLICDFIQVTSYDGTSSTGVIHLKKDISEDIKDKDLVIVEDIVDTGLTLNYLKQYIQIKYKPRSITVVCFIDKKPLRKVDFKCDYVGVTLNEKKFLFGYGFDYHEIGRNVPYVYVPDQKQIEEMDKIVAENHLADK
ncbi:MAG: hypoxanthine phosphoribosyltransferase [Bacilli bacterium]